MVFRCTKGLIPIGLLPLVMATCSPDQGLRPSPGREGDPAPRGIADTLDQLGPEILSHLPVDNEPNVPVTSSIAVSFDDVLDPNTVNTASFVLTGPDGPVDGVVVVKGNSVAFVPDQSLIEFRSQYVWTLTTDIRDEAGNSLASDYTARFTTALLDADFFYRVANQRIGDVLSLEIPPGDSSCAMASTAETAAQRWRLQQIDSSGVFVLTSRSTGTPRLLNGGDGMTACYVNGAGQIADPLDGQRWTPTSAGGPYFRLHHMGFGPARSLDIDASNVPFMGPTGNVGSQLWKFLRLGPIN